MASGTEAFILRLPDEILDPLLRIAAKKGTPAPRHRQAPYVLGTKAALPLVCRRFHRLTISRLYADISIHCRDGCVTGDEDWGDQFHLWTRTRLLHRTLRQNPSLWPYCRKLTIDTRLNPGILYKVITPLSVRSESPVSNLLYIAVDFVTWLSGTTCLTIIIDPLWNGDPFWKMNDIMKLVRLGSTHMLGLGKLRINHLGSTGISLYYLFYSLYHLGLDASLRELDLCGISKIGNWYDWQVLLVSKRLSSFTLYDQR